MSESESDGAGNREVAYRLFAAEFDDADFSYSESDEDRAPNYVVTPTGARVNRLFAVGVLTEVEQASDDVLRARVVDPTGAFVVYAGQYQPDEQAFLDRADPPAFVSVTGKARTFQPDDADVVYTSVRPESINEVDADTRDRWTVQTARQTLGRVARMADALQRDERGDDLRAVLAEQGLDGGSAAGIPLAIDHYGTSPAYLEATRTRCLQALEVVAGERDEIDAPAVEPAAAGDADLAAVRALDVDRAVAASAAGEEATGATAPGTDASETTTADTDASEDTTADTDDSESPTADTSTSHSATADSPTAQSEPETAEETGERSDADTETATASTDTATQSPESTVDPEGTESVESPDAGDGGDASGASTEGDDELEDFEPGEFDLDEEEREAVKEEYGTEFQSGTEVDEPGAADIEPEGADAEDGPVEPTAEAADASAAEAADASAAEAAVDTADDEHDPADTEVDVAEEDDREQAANAAPAGDGESAATEDVDLDTAVMDAMEAHDDGDGATRDEIVEAVVDRVGAEADAVEDAIQDALMDGRCYEPDDGRYKPI